MSTSQRLFKNTTILVLANALQPLISFYLIVTISRTLNVEGLGAYTTILKYVAVFQIIAGFGLRSLLTREIAQNREKVHRYLTAVSNIAIGLGVVAAIAMSLLVSVIAKDTMVIHGTMFASISLVAAALIDAYEGVISGFERLAHIGYASIMENIIRVGLSLWLIYQGYGVIALIWVYVGTRYLKPIYYFIYIKRKFATPIGKSDWPFTKALAGQARTFALISVCVIIYWNADGIMLEAMRSKQAAGYYSAAYRFFLFSIVLVDSFVNSLFPVISNFFKTSGSDFEAACRKSLRMLAIVTIPIAVSISLLADKIILLFYGSNYAPSIPVLKILIWALVPYAVSQIFAYALVASNNQKIDLAVNAASMVSNIVLNFLLIPRYGFIGATVATLISIHIYVALQLPFVFQRLIRFDVKDLMMSFVRVLLLGLLMAALIVAMRNLNLFLIVPVAFLAYGLGIFVLRVLPESDKKMLFRAAKKFV